MINYEDYVNLDIIPPPLFFGFALIGFLPLIGFFVCFCCRGRTAKRLELYCLLGMYKVISFIFSDAIQKREVNLDENGREVVGMNQTVVRKVHKFILFNRIISRLLIPFVFPSITVFFACFFVAFWEMFLNVESQNTCDPDLDCFPLDTDLNPLQNHPIVNCTDFNTSENVAIICYQLVFNTVDALGLAGGLLSLTQVSIKLSGRVLVWSMQPCREEGESYCCKRYCFWSDSPQRHDDIDLFLPDDLEAGGCCRCKPICYTNYKLNPHYNKVQYCCCSYCYPCFKIAVRVALVLVPLIIYIILFVAYYTNVPIIEMFQNTTFLAYTLISLYLGLLSFVFVITLQCSKLNKYQTF